LAYNANMPKHVVLVGHCGPDTSYLRHAVRSASRDAHVTAADDAATLQRALEKPVDLVLVNRTLDDGFEVTSGIELIRQLSASHPSVRFMLVSNYPDAQADAVAVGAMAGFGKRDIGSPLASGALKNALEKMP
jgi:two-component system, chemotaxis family, chemotaxis protein CheY